MTATILTARGNYFDFMSPETSVFGVAEIAHALARICRFTGHTSAFYSVAQHAVLVSYVVPPEHALQGLHHDDAEAFVGDVASPLKALLPDYRQIERRVELAVWERLGLPATLHPDVKRADLTLLVTEQRDLMPSQVQSWAPIFGVEALERRIRPWTPEQAESAFLARHEELAAQSFGRCITDKATIEAAFKADAEAEARAEKGLP